MKPACGGRSLSILSRIEGDPAWWGAVAPALRWAKEVWARATRVTDCCCFLGGAPKHVARCVRAFLDL
eukprot:8398395-Pyramimonas_sp.AAC.1